MPRRIVPALRAMQDLSIAAGPSGGTVQSLYLEHHEWLRHWLGRKVGDTHQAADLAHDTFVRLLATRRQTFGSEPRALLRHVANGLVIDQWRRQQVEKAYQVTLASRPEAQAPSAESRYQILDALTRIWAMLEDLPARTREVFLLAQLDGLTLQQIAERSAMPVITVRRHIRKALLACLQVAGPDGA